MEHMERSLRLGLGLPTEGAMCLLDLRALCLSLLRGPFLSPWKLHHRFLPIMIQSNRPDQEERSKLWDIYMITSATMPLSRPLFLVHPS